MRNIWFGMRLCTVNLPASWQKCLLRASMLAWTAVQAFHYTLLCQQFLLSGIGVLCSPVHITREDCGFLTCSWRYWEWKRMLLRTSTGVANCSKYLMRVHRVFHFASRSYAIKERSERDETGSLFLLLSPSSLLPPPSSLPSSLLLQQFPGPCRGVVVDALSERGRWTTGDWDACWWSSAQGKCCSATR